MKNSVLILMLAYVVLSLPNIRAENNKATELQLCDSSNVYRIDDPMIAEKGFATSPAVEINPQFPGKVEALQKFFDEKLKLSEETKNLFVRVHIKFTVNCKGKIGDFKILSPAAPDVAGAIMKVAEQMPDWEAGQDKGKEVDTHTKLGFTISQGRAKVSYK